MYRKVDPASTQTPDVQTFIDLGNRLGVHSFSPARELFDASVDLIVARAPGDGPAVLSSRTSGSAIQRVAAKYSKETGREPIEVTQTTKKH